MEEIYVLEDLLNTMVQLEARGCEFYQACREWTSDMELKQIFGELAGAEKNHEKFYRNILEKKTQNLGDRLEIDDDYKSYMDGLIDNHFSLYGKDLGADTLDEVLELAERMEKDTILFLSELKELLTGIEGIQQILNEEKRHLLRIYHYKKIHLK